MQKDISNSNSGHRRKDSSYKVKLIVLWHNPCQKGNQIIDLID